jgi:hypothetical protein
MNEITFNGVVYIPKAEAEARAMAIDTNGLRYCIIRTYSAGVHAGYVKEHNGKEVTLINARRIWRWAGAFTLSELAKTGVEKPDECKFSVTVPEIILTEAIEIIPCTETAMENIQGVKDYEC